MEKVTVVNHVWTAIRVVYWLQASGNTQLNCSEYIGWLHALKKQVGTNIVSKTKAGRDPEVMEAKGKWVQPGVLTKIVVALVDKATAAVQAATSTTAKSLGLATQIHNALLAAMFWGYLPPLRPHVVITLLLPMPLGQALPPP